MHTIPHHTIPRKLNLFLSLIVTFSSSVQLNVNVKWRFFILGDGVSPVTVWMCAAHNHADTGEEKTCLIVGSSQRLWLGAHMRHEGSAHRRQWHGQHQAFFFGLF